MTATENCAPLGAGGGGGGGGGWQGGVERGRGRAVVSGKPTIDELGVTSLHLSHSLFDRCCTKDDRATTVLHSSLFLAFQRASPNFNPVHSVTLSYHLLPRPPLPLPPCKVPRRTIPASPADLVLCPYHLSFRFFTEVRRSS